MRNIAIIGAGQAGLLLAIGLRKQNYNVMLYSNRSSAQISTGKIMSSQGMFHNALSIEEKFGLNYWTEKSPKNIVLSLNIISKKNKSDISLKGRTSQAFQSVDQRIKFSYWQDEFVRLGGHLIVQEVTQDYLNEVLAKFDLTIVSTGKGELGKCFHRDDSKSEFSEPQRVLSCLYVRDTTSTHRTVEGVHVNIIPRVGEYSVINGLTGSGSCAMMLFEGIPGGPFDSWKPSFTPQDHLEHAKKLLREHLPWEAELHKNITLTDENATLYGSFTPVVNKPIAKLPSSKSILGLGDAVVLLDPLAGQGANNAAKAADIYYKRIIAHGENEFTDEWMQETFDEYWEKYAKWSTAWTSILLKPPEPHVLEYFNAASEIPELADKLAEGFNEPKSLFPWITDPQMTRAIIREAQQIKREV